MIKAKNINDLANNLLEDFLKQEDREFYVPIYDEILQERRDTIINDRVEAQTFFVAGQAGTGKTTALNFLEDDKLKKRFYVKYINMRDFLETRDVDILDFLLTFAFALVKDTPLEDRYYEELVELQKKKEGDLIEEAEKEKTKTSGTGVESGVSGGGGFLNFIKLRASVFTYLKMDTLHRKKTREVFKLKAPKLLDLVNKLIELYIEKITKGKQLLVIIDDLDKLRRIDQINALFLDNNWYIKNLRCKKIFSIPTYLTTAPEISNFIQNPIPQFVLNLKPTPKELGIEKKKERENIEQNKKLLKEVIKVRIDPELDLIDEKALEIAVEFSGGIIRQLVSIVRQAAVKVRSLGGKKIGEDDVTEAIHSLRNTMARTITSIQKIDLLDIINREKKPVTDTSEEFLEVLLANNVLAYQNGNVWYEVNPLIKDTVEIYAQKSEDE